MDIAKIRAELKQLRGNQEITVQDYYEALVMEKGPIWDMAVKLAEAGAESRKVGPVETIIRGWVNRHDGIVIRQREDGSRVKQFYWRP